MDISAIYHKPDKNFCFALDKGKFVFRIRVKKDDIQHITLHLVDKYFSSEQWQQPMKKVASDGFCDYYETIVHMDVVCMRYFFTLKDTRHYTVDYGNYQFFNQPIRHIDKMFDCPQNLREEERFIIPDWAENKVVYQIFPSRFATTQTVPDKVWYQSPVSERTELNGNLAGIAEHIDHFKDLGVDIIYMTPVFQANSHHKYDTVDYFKIDSAFGTEQDLQHLVQEAHARGIRVILDAVFNHTSTDFFAFRDIRENGEQSAYKDWYYIDRFPLKAEPHQKPTYKSFAYYGGMPKLNLQNPEVQDYVLKVVRYWMRSCHIDGWRLDVGDEISHRFWKLFRTVVKEENPDALIVGETWHYTGDFLEGDEWDTIMNYDFRNAVLGFTAFGDVSASQFVQQMGFLRGNTHTHVYPVLWNLIDSHDTERALFSCKENRDKFKLSVAIQLLSEGMPMIYYGDEYGLSGGSDPDCRRGMLWKDDFQDKAIYEWYRKLIALRRQHTVITKGTVIDSYTDDVNGIVIFTKELNNQKITLMFHSNDKVCTVNGYHGIDLLTEEPFDGTLRPYQTVILQPTEK